MGIGFPSLWRLNGGIGRLPYLGWGAVLFILKYNLDRAIVWANSRISQDATIRRSILGRHCHIGRSAVLEHGAVLGDKSVITDHSRL